jgi:dihydrofolate reductase
VDTVLLGRNNYEGFHGYWAPMANNPESPRREAEFSCWLNQAQTIIYSTMLPAPEWENTTLYRAIEPKQVRQLKAQPGGDIVVMNSASVGRALLGMGLLDELRINIHPVVLGSGQPLFTGVKELAKLELVQARASAFGVIECLYRQPGG